LKAQEIRLLLTHLRDSSFNEDARRDELVRAVTLLLDGLDGRLHDFRTLIRTLGLGVHGTTIQLFVEDLVSDFADPAHAPEAEPSGGGDLLLSSAELEALVADAHESDRVPDWAMSIYQGFSEVVARRDFPCLFARRMNHLKTGWFHFVESVETEAGCESVKSAVTAYLGILPRLSRSRRTLMPLLVAVKPEDSPLPLEAYHAQAWGLLQYLHDHDPEPWPEAIPTDPDRGDWSFCFAGQQLFSNVSCPAHELRQSRRLGDALIFVMQPRTNFDLVAGNNPRGRIVRNEIRKRLERYDGHIVPPELGYFGTPQNREWNQMAVPDGDKPYPAVCPLRIRRRSSEREEDRRPSLTDIGPGRPAEALKGTMDS
jgi:FPC/CPF motif-containing protein YcgG